MFNLSPVLGAGRRRHYRTTAVAFRPQMLILAVLIVIIGFAVMPDIELQDDTTTGSDLNDTKQLRRDDLVLSRLAPAFASSGFASAANDVSYDTAWQSNLSKSWLAYDISDAPSDKKDGMLLVWYNDATGAYDPSLTRNRKTSRDFPNTYVIETNAAPGGGKQPPADGWTVRTTIYNNQYHSRQHVLDVDDANWVRLRIENVQGGGPVRINMDLYPLEEGLSDNWIFYGSSTPARAMSHLRVGPATQTFSQMVAKARPGTFPVQENGSIGGITSTDGARHFDTWLSIFPGKYVYIGLGANDAADCMPPSVFYANMSSMVSKTLRSGKVPVVPKFNWSKLPTVQRCGPALIQEIDRLYQQYPQIVRGPDFWNYYKSNPGQVSGDKIHPTLEGMGMYRQMVTQTMLREVYHD